MRDASNTPQICPPPETIDMLELVRSGVLAISPQCPIEFPNPLKNLGSEAELVDPEGVPLGKAQTGNSDKTLRIEQEPVWLGTLSPRPFEHLFVRPAVAREASSTAIPLIVDRRITNDDLDSYGARQLLLLVLAGPSTDPDADVLAALRSAAHVGAKRSDTTVVAVPLSRAQATNEPALLLSVMAAYSDRDVQRLPPVENAPGQAGTGTVLFFTGLSGSGKSTVARAVRNAILEHTDQSVTLLDGDVVRRHLSAGLGYAPPDRETNIRRIGWVAAQIAHHGGLVICSPIAPYAATRAEVREMAESRGCRFVLVHVSTPVEECERRDRKGLYAKARRGELRDFTGIDAPYEAPHDADLQLDTTTLGVDDACSRVLDLLMSGKDLR